MTNTAVQKELELTDEERERFTYHSEEIQSGIRRGIDAKNEVLSHVLSVLQSNPPLWRENYTSEEDYVKTELNIEMSSFWRNVKDNRNYLHLISNTEDVDEQITLSRMRGAAYRELRQLATDNKPLLKIGGEPDDQYRKRLIEKEEQNAELIEELWKEVYPRISKFKKESNTGIYPTGGYSITAKDITETCQVLNQIMEIPKQLSDGLHPSEIAVSSLEGRDISLQSVMDESNEYSDEVINAITDLGISEALTEKLHRQSQHIKDSLEKRYVYDRYVGTLIVKYGKLVIENEYGEYDLTSEFSDMIGKDTVISIRREARES